MKKRIMKRIIMTNNALIMVIMGIMVTYPY